MVYENCPMFGGYGVTGFYLNWVLVAVIFSIIFWGAYHLLIKNREKRGREKK